MRLRHPLFLSTFFLVICTVSTRADSEEKRSSSKEGSATTDPLVLPSKKALEQVIISFLDATIKSGQIAMAKSAFQTQLQVIKKIKPDQYKKYKKMGVDEMAAEAVMRQAEMAAAAPRSGNAFIDMLGDNGIPVASSIKGVEDAIRTQKQLENQDPSEQIAKAVFEKFQTQILPGLVANLIAGRNPFKLARPAAGQQSAPTLRQPGIQGTTDAIHNNIVSADEEQEILRSYEATRGMRPPSQRHPSSYQRRQVVKSSSVENVSPHSSSSSPPSTESLGARLSKSRRLSHLLENAEVVSLLSSSSRRLHDSPILDAKSALLLGVLSEPPEDEEDSSSSEIHIERSPQSKSPVVYTLRSALVSALISNQNIREALKTLPVRTDRVDELMRPAPLPFPTKDAKAGLVAPRALPKRPRKMLPLMIGVPSTCLHRKPSSFSTQNRRSRVLENLQNNPRISPLFLDGDLEKKLAGRQMLSDDQKGRSPLRIINTHPRFAAKAGGGDDNDYKITQAVEQREVPPLIIGAGRHTRIRWTGARESEVPGVGGRFILPSFDPTMPALNTAYSTQGRLRDEWDTTWKVPNAWKPGDEVQFSVKQKSQRFMGGDGNAEMPATGWRFYCFGVGSKCSRMGCPAVLFHPFHGENIALLENRRRAFRRTSFEKSLVFSERALHPLEPFLVSIEQTENGWTGHLRVGLTRVDPSTEPEGLDTSSWLVSVSPWTSVSASRSSLPTEVGSRVGVYFEPDGAGQSRLHLLLDDVDVLPTGVRPIPAGEGPLFAVVDVFGNTKEVRIAEAHRQPPSLLSLCTRIVRLLVRDGRCSISRLPSQLQPLFLR